MSTDTADMLSRDLPWRQLDIEYEKLFPQFMDNVLVVIEAETPDQASDSAKEIYTALSANPKFINDIYYPSLLPYFRQSAFLFLEQDELQDMADKLATIQPFLGTLLTDKTIRGLFNMLDEAIQAKQDGEDIDLKPLLREINKAFENENYHVSWQRLMSSKTKDKSIYREFIMLQTLEDKEEFLPGEFALSHIRTIINSTKITQNPTIKVRLTGGTALSYEELKSVSDANIKAIIISFILVAFILSIGLGSIWLVTACLITLFTGLITTTAFAAATVGELNLISVAFAVLYIGLGIDFAIHLALRYREEYISSENINSALEQSIKHIYRSLTLCVISTAIGFYSFMPTDYVGVAELGWIAGSGMFISFLFTMTLLPAILSLRPYNYRLKNPANSYQALMKIAELPYKYSKQILLFTLLITAGLLSQINKISFDTNTLNLQAPENESVQTYRDLLNDSDTSPWKSVLLKKDKTTINAIKERIEKLDVVDKVVWLEELIPENQDEKLFIIDDMNLFMGVLSSSSTKNIDDESRLESINNFRLNIKHYTNTDIIEEIRMLDANLEKLVNSSNTKSNLIKIESQLLTSLDGRIDSLNDALGAKPVTHNDLPESVSQRWTSNDYYKLVIYPKENLNDNAAMKRFVKQLQAQDNEVIGSPVISIEAGEAVLTAFKSAFTYAFIAITLLLFILIKIKFDAIIILISVLTGAIFTMGFMLLFNIPLNFANIIGLPLLLGIGVDSGIHIADRFRHEKINNIFMTSSSRGVIVSSLTTICSIGNLAFSSHQGTASMGMLLAFGLTSMMISTMLILPAFLVWQNSIGKNSHEYK